jgi:tetratricopeptide (TPR) repeat protein
MRKHGPPFSALEADAGRLRTLLAGTPLTVSTLANLPPIAEPVLLDIDTDFLLIPKICGRGWDAHSVLPWCWPEELLSRLERADIEAALATIAYSTEGGYTPLAWKYLGEELALRLGAEERGARLSAAAELRAGTRAEAAGDRAAAEARYRRAQAEAPQWAAPEYRLAICIREQGRLPEARARYARALELDSSYRGLYGSAGMIRLWEGRFSEAELEFRRALELDPEDGYAHYGLAELACERGDFTGAVANAGRALETSPHFVVAHRVRGEALAALGRIPEAISAYETSLRLALEGHKPPEAGILSDPDRRWRLDPMHGRTHAALAHLYARLGRRREAIAGLRISLGCGYDTADVRLALAANYAHSGKWRKAAGEMARGLVRLPAQLKRRLERRWRIARADRHA